jgi:uncharacterized membrane protein
MNTKVLLVIIAILSLVIVVQFCSTLNVKESEEASQKKLECIAACLAPTEK